MKAAPYDEAEMEARIVGFEQKANEKRAARGEAPLPGNVIPPWTPAPEDTTPPDLAAERDAIGSLILWGPGIEYVPFLEPDDFVLPLHQRIFRAARELHAAGSVADVMTISDALRHDADFNALNGAGYLGALAIQTPTSMNLVHYARLVERDAAARRLAQAGTAIRELAAAGLPITEAQAKSAEKLAQAARPMVTQGPPESALYDELYDQWTNPDQAALPGIATGITPLDRKLGLMQPGSLIVLGAGSGTGKTSLACTIAHHVACTGDIPVLFFSIEMPSRDIRAKVVSIESQIPYAHLEARNLSLPERHSLSRALAVLKAAPMEIVNASGYTASQIRTKTREFSEAHGGRSSLIVVDYLQRVTPDTRTENQNQALTALVNAMKEMAMETESTALVLSSLNRANTDRMTGEPAKEALRDSGSIEFTADTILLLWRERDESGNEILGQPVATVKCKIDKHRMGERGLLSLGFKGDTMQFVPIDRNTTEPF